MKRHTLITSNFISSVAFFVAALLSGSSVITAQSYRLFAVSDLVRIFDDGYKLPATYDTIKIFGIRGEIISGQFALAAKKSLTNVTVEVSLLKNQKSGSALPPNVTDWSFVGSIPLSKNTPNQPLSAVVRTAPASFPDYLMSEKQINVKEKIYQAVWLTINIPENAEAGNYLGKVTVKSVQGDQSLPVYLTVYPLTLPSERHLKVIEWYSLILPFLRQLTYKVKLDFFSGQLAGKEI